MHNEQKIKKARQVKGYTEQQMADKLGVSRSTYRYWEVVPPAFEKILAISDILEVPASSLIDENSPNYKLLPKIKAEQPNYPEGHLIDFSEREVELIGNVAKLYTTIGEYAQHIVQQKQKIKEYESKLAAHKEYILENLNALKDLIENDNSAELTKNEAADFLVKLLAEYDKF